MRHPYQIEHESYLDRIERSARRSRRPFGHGEYGAELSRQLRGTLVIGVIVAALAFIPWGALPI